MRCGVMTETRATTLRTASGTRVNFERALAVGAATDTS